jgi:hypothetical protein
MINQQNYVRNATVLVEQEDQERMTKRSMQTYCVGLRQDHQEKLLTWLITDTHLGE